MIDSDQERDVATIVLRRCRAVFRKKQFAQAVRAGWLSAADTDVVFLKTKKRIQTATQRIESLPAFASYAADKEAARYYQAALVTKWRQDERLASLKEQAAETAGLKDDPLSMDPAHIAESREQCEIVRKEVARLPHDQAALVNAWMDASYGAGAIATAGEQLGLSRAAAYKLFDSAKRLLRERLEHVGFN